MKLKFTGFGCQVYQHLFQIHIAIHFSGVVASVTRTAQEIVSSLILNPQFEERFIQLLSGTKS
jgi:hypothetical protein